MSSEGRKQRRPVGAHDLVGGAEVLDDVYRLNIGAIWKRFRMEPLYFWLFFGYVFFEYFRPQTIFPFIDVLPWAPMLIAGAFFLFVFDSRANKSLSGPLTFPVLGCFAVTFISFVFAFDPSWSFARADVLINWVLVYVLFLWIVNTKFRLFLIFLLLLLIAFKMAQHGFRVSLARGFAFQRWGVGGHSGWFQNAADLGVLMAIYTAWSVAFYYGLRDYWQRRWMRWLFLFFPVAGIATAIATGQRNTTLAFAMMGVMFVVFSKNRARNLLILSMVGAVAFALASDEFKARFEQADQSGTAQTRLHYWTRGMEFYASNPVIGVGYNNYVAYYAAHHPDEGFGRTGGFQVAHSVPVTVAAETGTLGFLFYYLVVAMVFVTNARSARVFAGTDPPFWRYLALSLNYGLVGIIVAGVFISIAFYPFLWFQAGLTASLYTVAKRESVRGKALETHARVRPVRAFPSKPRA